MARLEILKPGQLPHVSEYQVKHDTYQEWRKLDLVRRIIKLETALQAVASAIWRNKENNTCGLVGAALHVYVIEEALGIKVPPTMDGGLSTAGDQSQKHVLDLLRDLYSTDPLAMSLLLMNRVGCNNELADHPGIISVDTPQGPCVSALGLINGVLLTLGIPRVAVQLFSDNKTLTGKFFSFSGKRAAKAKKKPRRKKK